ncbi:MAG: methyltransferase domain-containing protein [Candidatus Izemoplasmatales bacterium]
MGKNKLEKLYHKPGSETSTVAPLVLEYCKGRGVDIGCGFIEKITDETIGVDIIDLGNLPGVNYGNHDLKDGLPMFSNCELDFVYASHVLEDLVDPLLHLIEWARVLKPGGFMIIVLPHGDVYAKAGTPEANPSHLQDWWPETLYEYTDQLDLELVDSYTPEDCMWHSFVAVFKKG